MLNNYGTLTVSDGASLIVNGALNNFSFDTLNNYGMVTIGATGVLCNGDGTENNAGRLRNLEGGVIQNAGKLVNSRGSLVENNGAIISREGASDSEEGLESCIGNAGIVESEEGKVNQSEDAMKPDPVVAEYET